MLHDSKLEWDNVLVVYPVLGRAPDEGVLASTSRRVALNRVSTGSNEVVQFGKLDDEVIVVHAVERVRLEEVLAESRFEREPSQFLPVSRRLLRTPLNSHHASSRSS